MKTQILKTRLEKRFTGAKNSAGYQIVKSILESKNADMIRPCYTSGRGRFTTNMDHTQAVENILTLIGVKYESGNDSPRGGKTGNYIKILTKIN